MIRIRRGVIIATLVLLTGLRLNAQTEGIFADFKTSMGSFTCRLDYTVAPKAVANFVALATGQRAWLDLTTGLARTTPFYDGLIFHRVIADFMIQSGSRNGKGTDDPGYVFQDEFSPTARHDGPGVLSMANSGPGSNGAQFFITAAATPWLNDLHTVFGRVTSGQNIVNAINKVATDTNDVPKVAVVLQSVSIRRVGAAAQAFNIQAQNLPTVANISTQISRSGDNVKLVYANVLNADNRIYESTNLAAWAENLLGIDVVAPISNSIERPATNHSRFYRGAQIRYPTSTFAPRNVHGRTLTLAFSDGAGTVRIVFNATGGGTYTYNSGQPANVTEYEWFQEPYTGLLWPIYYEKLVPMTLRLAFTSATAGRVSGKAYQAGQAFDVSGTFSLEP